MKHTVAVNVVQIMYKFIFLHVTELVPFIAIDIINLHRLLDLRQEFTNLNTLLCNRLLIFGSSIISGISAHNVCVQYGKPNKFLTHFRQANNRTVAIHKKNGNKFLNENT